MWLSQYIPLRLLLSCIAREMASNAAAEPPPPLVLKIVAVAEKAEDVLFEKQGDIRSMEVGLEYTLQRLADLADQQEKAPAKEKKHFLLRSAASRSRLLV